MPSLANNNNNIAKMNFKGKVRASVVLSSSFVRAVSFNSFSKYWNEFDLLWRFNPIQAGLFWASWDGMGGGGRFEVLHL